MNSQIKPTDQVPWQEGVSSNLHKDKSRLNSNQGYSYYGYIIMAELAREETNEKR